MNFVNFSHETFQVLQTNKLVIIWKNMGAIYKDVINIYEW